MLYNIKICMYNRKKMFCEEVREQLIYIELHKGRAKLLQKIESTDFDFYIKQEREALLNILCPTKDNDSFCLDLGAQNNSV